MLLVLLVLVTALNFIAFIMMGVDKSRAERDLYRIPEKSLLLACAPFAALGGLIGMRVFHHKTRKPKFSVGVPLMLAAQALVLFALLKLFL